MTSIACTVQKPTMLMIDVSDATLKISESLETRLARSPVKSPEAREADAKKKSSNSTALRAAHLEAVRDRAHREVSRAADAAARKLRLNADSIDKVSRRISASDKKSEAKKEAALLKMAEAKSRRNALAAAVAERNAQAHKSRVTRSNDLLKMHALASSKRERALQQVVDKNQMQISHALAVAQMHKDKEREAVAAAGAAIVAKQEAAALKRQDLLLNSPTSPTTAQAVRHRIFNNNLVESGFKRRSLDAQMAAAVANREQVLSRVASKARAVSERAALVVEKIRQESDGTSAENTAEKQALYRRMVAAETARVASYRTRAARLVRDGSKTSSPLIFITASDSEPTPMRDSLLRRLALVPKNLLFSAAARQAGAKARRFAAVAAGKATAAKRAAGCQAAIGRHLSLRAAALAKIDRRSCLGVEILSKRTAARSKSVATGKARTALALVARGQADKVRLAKGAIAAARCAAAADCRTTILKDATKSGRFAIRAAAALAARAAAAAKASDTGVLKVSRAEATTARLKVRLEARAATAKLCAAPRGARDAKATDGFVNVTKEDATPPSSPMPLV